MATMATTGREGDSSSSQEAGKWFSLRITEDITIEDDINWPLPADKVTIVWNSNRFRPEKEK